MVKRLGLIAVTVIACAAAGGGTAFLVYRYESAQLREAIADTLLAKAETLATVLSDNANITPDREALARFVRLVAGTREVRGIAVAAGDPAVILGASHRAWLGQALTATGNDDWLDLQRAVTSSPRFVASEDFATFDYVKPVVFDNLNIGDLQKVPGLVLVRLDGRAHAAVMEASQWQHLLLLMLVPSIVLACLLALLAWQVLVPLARMGRVLRRRAEGDLGARPGPMPNRDLEDFAGGLSKLLDDVDAAQAHLRGIFDAASDAIVTIDGSGAIRQFNPGAEVMFGVRAVDAMGTNIKRFVPEPERSEHDGYLKRFLTSGVERVIGFAREVMAERADGSKFHCSLLVNTADVAGETLFVGVMRDISDEIAVRRELEQARIGAESAAKTKSSFLANMSHEIRTPLTAILGYSEELEHAELSADEARQGLQVIRQNGEHLMTVINDILDLSKIEAGAMRVEHIACQPDELANQVVGMMQGRAKGKGLELELCLTTPMPVSIQSDPTRLRQILINLIGNAIKFTEHGKVTVELAADFAEERLAMHVRDTGIGMTKAQQERLFQSFSQAEEGTSRKYGGTGLGLHISKRLASMLGGDLGVQSEKGVGSCFSCTIATGPITPVATRATAVRVAPVRHDIPKLHGRVLLAEDGRDNQVLIKRVLASTGLSVEIVDNGQKARDAALAATGTPFDLIVMDVQMPVMDGLQATRELRAAGFAAPIVALTANVLPEDVQRCMDAGCSYFATKPLDRTALFEVLQQALGQPTRSS